MDNSDKNHNVSSTVLPHLFDMSNIHCMSSQSSSSSSSADSHEPGRSSSSINTSGRHSPSNQRGIILPSLFVSHPCLSVGFGTSMSALQRKKIKHQDIKQKEPPQKYRLGTISNTKLLDIGKYYRTSSELHTSVLHCIDSHSCIQPLWHHKCI